MKQTLRLPLDRTAMIFVDLQEEHRKDTRFLAHGYEAILANVARLQSAARAAGVKLAHCAFSVDMSAQANQPFHPVGADGKSAFSDSTDPLTAICPEVAPLDGETLIIKAEPSVISRAECSTRHWGTGRYEWLVLAGVWTEACVYETVKDAQRRGYRVLLVKDACGSGTELMHQTAVLNLANRLYGGAVADTDVACRLLAGEDDSVWRLDGAVPFRYDVDSVDLLYQQL